MCNLLSWPTQGAIAKYQKLDSLKKALKFISHRSRGWKIQIDEPVDLVFGEGLFSDSQMVPLTINPPSGKATSFPESLVSRHYSQS